MNDNHPRTRLEYVIVSALTIVIPVCAGFFVRELFCELFNQQLAADIAATILTMLLLAGMNGKQEFLAKVVHRIFVKKR